MTRKKAVFIPAKPEKSCGKNRYKSRAEAELVADEQEIIFAHNDLKLKAYLCADCGGWHLTQKIDNENKI